MSRWAHRPTSEMTPSGACIGISNAGQEAWRWRGLQLYAELSATFQCMQPRKRRAWDAPLPLQSEGRASGMCAQLLQSRQSQVPNCKLDTYYLPEFSWRTPPQMGLRPTISQAGVKAP